MRDADDGPAPARRDPADGLVPGLRAAVRHRLPERDPATGASLTDTVGDVITIDAETVTLRTRRRGDVVVERSRITAARVVPARD
ncbi:hypothetical protein [Janibacter massiliensis]|uniref:hypothetical protein n=1 Tax=Janibacter massiliensis TaxID=2058291 RepID=UPI001F1A02AF|nr:hypothetical protein [Janibacter massiliensis]